MKRAGWTRLSPTGACKTVGRFRHDASGLVVRHCGHPTALWPYMILPADGGRAIVSWTGHGFKTLAVAMDVAERVARGGLSVVERGVPVVRVDTFGRAFA